MILFKFFICFLLYSQCRHPTVSIFLWHNLVEALGIVKRVQIVIKIGEFEYCFVGIVCFVQMQHTSEEFPFAYAMVPVAEKKKSF